MIMHELDNFYLSQKEPVKGCLLALRTIILNHDEDITAGWKYRMPMFCYKGKMLCYLWVHKKLRQPYLGIVDGKLIDHPSLMMEKRARMKIMLFDANKNLPIADIEEVLTKALQIATLKH